MTFVVEGDPETVEMVAKNLHKLVEVIKVVNISSDNTVSRELALVRVNADLTTRSEIMQIVDIFRAKIVDVSQGTLIVEVTGDENKVDSLVDLLRTFGIHEVMRTGTIAMSRGVSFEGDTSGITLGKQS
jgi:acetolactate synthase-1/3 small subunit